MMNEKVLNVLLWIAQLLLTGMFFMAGYMKVSTSIDVAIQQMPWAADIPELLFRFIGFAEIAGAIGIFLPALLRIQPKLTPLAAMGLIAVMFLAAMFHVSRGEYAMLGTNVFLALIAFFVYWGRTRKLPIKAR
ncbi:MAG: DoxX family protein [Cyclobacteriaceae bacterium]